MKTPRVFSKRNRVLLAELVRTDFKLRYQASALGYVWSVLNPLLLFAILYIVFANFLGIGRDIEHFPVYLLLGIVLWRFFSEATNNGLKAIISRGGLIRKVNFPKYIIVISGTISSMINLAINLLVVFIFALINNVELSWSALMVFPLIIELYVFALGIAFFLAAVNVKFRDVAYLWDVFLQAAFYATPIIYPLTLVYARSELMTQILIINPVAQVIQDVRYFFITDQTLTAAQVFGDARAFIPIAITIAMLIFGALYFRRKSPRFAEDV